MADGLENNIALWRERIGNASAKWGGAEICAVTKTVDVDTINRAYAAGIRVIGENRVQEILEKYDSVKPVRWHLIGHLQKNKVKYIIDKVEMIHSVDSLDLAKEIDRRAAKIGKVQKILLEVNVSGEESKFGIKPNECAELCREIAQLKNTEIHGLMTVAPYTDDKELLKGIFRRLKQISLDIWAEKMDTVYMDELSMGMTNDYELAIAEGATMVRVGTGIFGKRDYGTK